MCTNNSFIINTVIFYKNNNCPFFMVTLTICKPSMKTCDALFFRFFMMASGMGDQAHGTVASQLYSSEAAASEMTTSEKVTHWPSLLITNNSTRYCCFCCCFANVTFGMDCISPSGGGIAKPGGPHLHRGKACYPQTGFKVLSILA